MEICERRLTSQLTSHLQVRKHLKTQVTGWYEHSQHNCCKLLHQWQRDMKKTCASRAEVCDLIPHKTFRLPGRRGFYYFSELPTQHQPMSSLPTSSCSHPSSIQTPLPGAYWLPATSNSNGVQLIQLVTPQVFWPVIQKSLHNLVNSLCCCLGKSLPALQPFAFGRFSSRPYGLNASPPLAMKA